MGGKNQLVPLVRRLVNANLVNVSMIKQACKVVKPLLFAQNMTIVTVTSIAIMQQRYAKRKKTLESLVRQATNVHIFSCSYIYDINDISSHYGGMTNRKLQLRAPLHIN